MIKQSTIKPLLFFYWLVWAVSLQGQPVLPADFYDILVDDSWNQAVGFTFDESGNMYLWEKAGVVHKLDTNNVKQPTPFMDISEEVGNYVDHGMLGFALDPNFINNGYVYALYVVDRHYWQFFGTPQYSPDSTAVDQATFARITRFQADASNGFSSILPNSRTILIGEATNEGIPILHKSHGIGTLLFGTDGTLMASAGDGSTFEGNYIGTNGDGPHSFAPQGLQDGIIRPAEDIGAYRAQLLNNYNGKVIRIDPATGEGVPSNPFYDTNNPDAPKSKIWALGLRNPFRMALRPGSGSHNPADGNPGALFIGDVGSGGWEELNVATEAGMNFGWPIFEGMDRNWGFDRFEVANLDAPNPLFGNGCSQEYFIFQDLLIQDAQTFPVFRNPCNSNETIAFEGVFAHRRPTLTYNNRKWNNGTRTVIPGYNSNGEAITINVLDANSPIESDTFSGIASIGGNFYQGSSFPTDYQNSFYSADYDGWIRRFDFDQNHLLTKVAPICEDCGFIVGVNYNPNDECLYYLRYQDELHKICFGGNPPPIAVASADVYYGPSPLTVDFTGDNSFDPNGFPISFSWDFGDGGTSSLANPTHEFIAPSNDPYSFTILLTVTDSLGETGTKELLVSLNNTPPQATITSFADGDFYPLSGNTLLPLEADVFDNESPNDELIYEWQAHFHHNTHSHPEQQENTQTATMLITPAGCLNEDYWYRATLKVTDPHGLSTIVEGALFPNCAPIFFELKYLEAIASDAAISVDWESIEETIADYYVVQRSSGDNNFEDLGLVDAHGVGIPYDFLDQNPLDGKNFYRLKVYNLDGEYEYSKIVDAWFPQLPVQSLFPNPAAEEITVFMAEVSEEAIVYLYDSAGRLIWSQHWYQDGELLETVDVSDLANGVYFYKLLDGEEQKNGKLVISK